MTDGRRSGVIDRAPRRQSALDQSLAKGSTFRISRRRSTLGTCTLWPCGRTVQTREPSNRLTCQDPIQRYGPQTGFLCGKPIALFADCLAGSEVLLELCAGFTSYHRQWSADEYRRVDIACFNQGYCLKLRGVRRRGRSSKQSYKG